MKSDLIFREYIWLVNTILMAKRITLEEISSKWQLCDLSNGKPMARSTFNRHKEAIEEMFGIYIECDKANGYKYFIENEHVFKEDSVQNWLFSTLSVNNMISECKSLHDRIVLESIPAGGDNLQTVLNSMKQNAIIKVSYKKYTSSDTNTYTIAPYCIKLFHRRLYLLGRKEEDGEFRTLSFDRIENISVTGSKFKMDKEFCAEQFYKDFFGIVTGDGSKAEHVVVRAYGKEREYMLDLPVHHTQKEITKEKEYSDFDMKLCLTLDLAGYFISRGSMVQILKPEWFRNKIRQMHIDALNLYNN